MWSSSLSPFRYPASKVLVSYQPKFNLFLVKKKLAGEGGDGNHIRLFERVKVLPDPTRWCKNLDCKQYLQTRVSACLGSERVLLHLIDRGCAIVFSAADLNLYCLLHQCPDLLSECQTPGCVFITGNCPFSPAIWRNSIVCNRIHIRNRKSARRGEACRAKFLSIPSKSKRPMKTSRVFQVLSKAPEIYITVTHTKCFYNSHWPVMELNGALNKLTF